MSNQSPRARKKRRKKKLAQARKERCTAAFELDQRLDRIINPPPVWWTEALARSMRATRERVGAKVFDDWLK